LQVIKKYFTPPDMSKPHPDDLAFADFADPEVAEDWVCRSDTGIGGFSQARWARNSASLSDETNVC